MQHGFIVAQRHLLGQRPISDSGYFSIYWAKFGQPQKGTKQLAGHCLNGPGGSSRETVEITGECPMSNDPRQNEPRRDQQQNPSNPQQGGGGQQKPGQQQQGGQNKPGQGGQQGGQGGQGGQHGGNR
jgi:hypothetical protein